MYPGGRPRDRFSDPDGGCPLATAGTRSRLAVQVQSIVVSYVQWVALPSHRKRSAQARLGQLRY